MIDVPGMSLINGPIFLLFFCYAHVHPLTYRNWPCTSPEVQYWYYVALIAILAADAGVSLPPNPRVGEVVFRTARRTASRGE